MIRKIIVLTLFKPPTTHGPQIEMLSDRIVAVQHSWDAGKQEPRATVHMMGGTEFLVCETPEQVWKLL